MLVSELVTRAARIAGKAGQGSALSAEDMSWGVDQFNDLMHSLALDGMDMGHTTQVSTDTLLIDEAYVKGVKYLLAVEMSIEGGSELMPGAAAIAIDEQGKIRAALCDIDEMRVDEALLGPKLTFDHTTGE